MAFRSSYAPPSRSFRDDLLDYIDTLDPLESPPAQSPNTPSPVSSISLLSISSVSKDMSRITRSRTASDVEIEPISRHPAYYIPSGDVVFLAGAQLFRVHRYFFVRESVKFRDMLSTIVPSGAELMGSSDSLAIPLTEVTKEEFESFLLIFYSDEYEYEAPLERWTAILRLAHLWQFPKIKALATRKMDVLDIEPVDMAVMAHQYEVDPAFGWLVRAYAAIGEREESISKAEADRLGLHVVVLLADLRESIRKTRFEQEKNELLQNSYASHRLSPIMSPSCLHGGLDLREEDAPQNPLKEETPPLSPISNKHSPVPAFIEVPACPEELPSPPIEEFAPPIALFPLPVANPAPVIDVPRSPDTTFPPPSFSFQQNPSVFSVGVAPGIVSIDEQCHLDIPKSPEMESDEKVSLAKGKKGKKTKKTEAPAKEKKGKKKGLHSSTKVD